MSVKAYKCLPTDYIKRIIKRGVLKRTLGMQQARFKRKIEGAASDLSMIYMFARSPRSFDFDFDCEDSI